MAHGTSKKQRKVLVLEEGRFKKGARIRWKRRSKMKHQRMFWLAYYIFFEDLKCVFLYLKRFLGLSHNKVNLGSFTDKVFNKWQY